MDADGQMVGYGRWQRLCHHQRRLVIARTTV